MSDTKYLLAVSPVDGRYKKQVSELTDYFSEYALMKYRVHVEIEYLIALNVAGLFRLNHKQTKALRFMAANFSVQDALHIKSIEHITNHDVKAVEYFVKECLQKLKLEQLAEWVHFGLTSQDINNTAIPLLWKDALQKVYLPELDGLIDLLKENANAWKSITMLAHTHGQPASPTKLGKEFMVFVERLINARNLLIEIPFAAKFGGATGNLNAHYAAFPTLNWRQFAKQFVEDQLGLTRMRYTTQIEHYDSLAAQFDALKRINNIFMDLSRDCWAYISMEYFRQKINPHEVGSSAMPHKVNPIDFENAEGNIGLANALFEHLSAKLPVSRLQRDLTDSTVLRNLGVPFAHTLIAMKALQRGFSKLIVNQEAIYSDLEKNWSVVAEAIQTILRRENYPKPYEALKALTRGSGQITRDVIHQFIDQLSVSDDIKMELKKITPFNYTGKS